MCLDSQYLQDVDSSQIDLLVQIYTEQIQQVLFFLKKLKLHSKKKVSFRIAYKQQVHA